MIAAHFEGRSGIGNRLQLLEQQAVQSLRATRRQLPLQSAIQRTHGGAGINDEDAGTFHMNVLMRDGGRVGGELTDDLLEDVLERDKALDVAVLIDDEGEAAPVALKVCKLHAE